MKKVEALRMMEMLEERFLKEYEKLYEEVEEGSLNERFLHNDKRMKSNAVTVVIKMIRRYLD